VVETIIGQLDMATEAWYEAIIASCGLSSKNFQLAQGVTPLPSTSDQLWSIFDAIPPKSINHYYDPAQYNFFSQNYGAIINNLWPQVAETMGVAERGELHALLEALDLRDASPTSLTDALTRRSFSSSVALELAHDPVVRAIALWVASGGSTGPKAYDQTIDDLERGLQQADGCTVVYEVNGDGNREKGNWAASQIQAPPKAITTKIARNSEILALATAPNSRIEAHFDHLFVCAASPLGPRASSSGVAGTQWYFRPALALAYRNASQSVWKAGEPSWESTFGSDGSLLRVCSSIVVVDGATFQATGATMSTEWSDPGSLAAIVPVPEASLVLEDVSAAAGAVRFRSRAPYLLGVNVTPIGEVLV
jgi:hypothetical protein